MTDLVDRSPADADAEANAPPRPLVLTATLAACWPAGLGLVVCIAAAVAAWFAGSSGGAAGAVRVGVHIWLLGHGSGLRAGGVAIDAVPLGLTLLSAVVLWRAARWAATAAAVDSLRGVVRGLLIVTVCYAAIAAVAAVGAATDAAAASPVRAFLAAGLVALVFGGGGLWSGADLPAGMLDRIPEDARATVRGASAATVSLLGVGALLVTVSLARAFGESARVVESLQAGLVGGVLLMVASVLLLPNAVLLATSFVLGPGFSFGAGTAVAPTGVTLGKVPAFPLVAALPDEGTLPWWATALVALPALAGAVGAVAALRIWPVFGYDHAALRGGGSGVLGGLASGLLTALAGGAVGPGRMADVGADVWASMAAAAAAMGLGGVVGGLAMCWWVRRRARRR